MSARRLFAEIFGAENVTVESDGNVYAATLFLQGLAAEEADPAMLAAYNPCFPVIIGVRARRPRDPGGGRRSARSGKDYADMADPKVSAIVIAYDGAAFLARRSAASWRKPCRSGNC